METEVPSGRLPELSRLVEHPRPINEFDALMRAAPNEDPEQTAEEIQTLRERVAEAVAALDDEWRFIIEAIHYERCSFQQLADRLGVGKTQAWRLTKAAEAALETILLTNPTISRRIRMYDKWQDAAWAATCSIAPEGLPIGDDQAIEMMDRKIERLRSLVHNRTADADLFCGPIATIGIAAANILDNAGAWSVDDMVDLLVRKQHDYGHGNINAFGLIGLVVRMSDKIARYHNLCGREGLAEPRIDALVDICGYAVIGRMLADGTFDLPLAEAAVA